MFTGVAGERRVKNVKLGGQPIDPVKKYTLVSDSYYIRDQGNGMAMLRKEDVIRTGMIDSESLMKYI